MIRAAAILQGLLGNVGRPGGGILALRRHFSIQGSTDIPTLCNMLPTCLPQPHAFKPHDNRLHAPADPRLPYVLTTYRVTEHHSAALPTRTTAVLADAKARSPTP